MSRPIATGVFASAFAVVVMTAQQPASPYPLMEGVAQKLIQKYESGSCAELAAEKSKPPDPQQAQTKDKALQQLRQDPEMRKAFINKVAAPIVNKMFDCGMIP